MGSVVWRKRKGSPGRARNRSCPYDRVVRESLSERGDMRKDLKKMVPQISEKQDP